MRVYLPKEFDKDNMYYFINEVFDENMDLRARDYVFDFTPLRFIRPVGVTVLSNIIGRLKKQGAHLSITYFEPDRSNRRCPMAFLDDAMFFKKFIDRTLDEKSSLRMTTLPLEHVEYNRSYEYLDYAMSWLAGKLNLTKESLGDIKSCLVEVFNNIIDHSAEHTGSIFVQHYPRESRVMVAISDFGVGIPSSIQDILPGVDDAEALLLAIKEGFTTKSTPKNRGAGLDFLLQNVVINNKGSVYIHSNHGILSSTSGRDGMEITSRKTEGFYPGTLLEIVFQTDTIEYVEEEFSWDVY
ncbi:hypothetical protein PBOR_23945 [Paenibacillus borealis]|uniref:Histidine kinase/HSP90-like ATPase domain-containing protein n=1 Tax=Paenibacillus borealis TaxID=160799 RepID=A0A089LFL1_PAEBO|nr:hypothetical protein PBOR_23945 [Paenibacillus borealis]